jgi:hypothetical protein
VACPEDAAALYAGECSLESFRRGWNQGDAVEVRCDSKRFVVVVMPHSASEVLVIRSQFKARRDMERSKSGIRVEAEHYYSLA